MWSNRSTVGLESTERTRRHNTTISHVVYHNSSRDARAGTIRVTPKSACLLALLALSTKNTGGTERTWGDGDCLSLLALSVSWTVPPLDLLLYLQWNPNQHVPGNPNLINRKRNRKESADSYLRRPSPSPSMEEWVAIDGGCRRRWRRRGCRRRIGGVGRVDNGEEEWVKWRGGVGPLVSEFCFDILKRVGIEYKTNSL